MPDVYVVRHGEATAGFSGHRDPGLSNLGLQQARETAARLQSLQPIRIYSSPLQRALETAQALADRWQAEVTIEQRIAEIPSPIHDLSDRSIWLADVMRRTWHDLPKELQDWRTTLIDCVRLQQQDCVMFSHFVAINLLVGEARQLSEVVSFRPKNASVTRIATDGKTLQVIELGDEAQTTVN